jgi:hypothetical protein
MVGVVPVTLLVSLQPPLLVQDQMQVMDPTPRV